MPERHYLHACRDLHPKVTKLRYGREQDLRRIEREVADVRRRHRLTYDHIEKIRNSEVWDADVFGYWPPRTAVEPTLEAMEWNFWNQPGREEETIKQLLAIFRQIEPVSVILRFIVPEHYGILSPPVETMLGLGPFRQPLERYRAYLKNLREIRNFKQFDTAADVDMALWVLQLGVLERLLSGCLSHEKFKCLKEEFRQDAELRAIRAVNLTGQLFSPDSDIGRVELAEALLNSDVESNIQLAGQIAGIEFERLVRELVRATPNDTLRRLVCNNLRELACNIYGDRHRVDRIVACCRTAVRTRNRAVHNDGNLESETVRHLLAAIGMLEEMKANGSR